jgi:Flp pilus assembly protein TadD/protein involved in polysaccharide export with SLBB domain
MKSALPLAFAVLTIIISVPVSAPAQGPPDSATASNKSKGLGGALPTAPKKDNVAQKYAPVRTRDHEKASKGFLELGVKHGLAGRYEEAIRAFEEAIFYYPDNADAHFSLGHVYYDLGRWNQAVEAFSRAVALTPRDAEAFNYLGASYFKLGRYEKAVDAYKSAVLIKPDSADVRYNIANAFFRLGRYEPAVLYYKEVTYLRPKSAESYNDMGVAYAEWGRYGEAADAFKRAAGFDSDDAYAQNNLALSYHLDGQNEKAAQSFNRAVQLKPDDGAIRRNATLASVARLPDKSAVGARVALTAGRAGGPHAGLAWRGRSEIVHGLRESAREQNRAADAAPPPPRASASKAPASGKPMTSGPASAAYVPSAPAPPLAKVSSPAVSPTPAARRHNGAAPGASAPRLSKPINVASLDLNPEPTRLKVAAEAVAQPSAVVVVEPTTPPAPATPPPVASEAPSGKLAEVPATNLYRVGAGDVLDVRLLDGNPTASTLYTVLSDGSIEYPLTGAALAVSGKTTDEIAAHLSDELKRRGVQENPRVTVGVREYSSHTVIVSGLVGEPGAKILRREALPFYVILADAQPRPEAGRAMITSYATGQRTEVLLDDQAALNTLVRPGDVVEVLTKRQQFYYIGGKVESPGEKEFRQGITLTQAILASGGLLYSSKTVLVTRQNAEGLLSTTTYALQEIKSGKAPDPPLQPGDRVEVIR